MKSVIIKYIRNWGSRLKVIYVLSFFISTKESLVLFITWFFHMIFKPRIGIVFFENKKNFYIKKWLANRYSYLVPSTFEFCSKAEKSDCNFIWVFWYQGEDAMPEIIKLCYKSICKNADGKKVVLLTKENFNNYVKIPNFILAKVEKGSISLTHLSDILRINLLYEYGGLWMDSTLFVNETISTESYCDLFYSIKNYPLIKGTISDYRWATFYLYCKKSSPVFKVFKDLFNAYLKENDAMIDYFLIDYFFDMLYCKNNEFKNVIDSIPYTEPNIHKLMSELNDPYHANKLSKKIKTTSVFKFNYRPNFIKELNHQETLYGHLIKKYL